MADYLAQGNKTVKCRCGCESSIPFQKTVHKCPSCGMTSCYAFHGVVKDKHGNYIY